ncbi:unnamed protein product [Adineta steineri]|uniref:Uncharacterized protein n=1 Tax=Adineta steineri TaxID=433720 RepID=A0A814A2S6_9BILA|nr:unnamed protein product [Adineta steineri]CAF0906101.1 unnamed protein product [Adineta steineri]CAF1115931.1 unnamed protein product [Adineta steineri]
MDVRKSLSAMWQLIATFCRYANSTLLEVLDEFANTPLISSKLIPEELLRTQTLTALNNVHQTALDSVNRSITSADRITQASGLMTGLATNAVARLPANGWQSLEYVPTFSTKYKRQESTALCYCINDVSCSMPGGLYFYEAWETNGIYDLNVIVANATIPGLVVDCLPTQTMFASTLECFYNQSCLNILLSAYQVNINISILNTSLSSRFTPTTTLSYLVNELFIEQIFNETVYGSYYQQCAPVYCSYTYSQRFDLVYVITTLIALFGGLNIALHLIAPYLIDCLLFLKKKLFLQNEFQQNETPIPTFQNRFHNLVKKVKESIVQLNLFESYSQVAHRVYRERILTRLYLILMTSAMTVLIFYTFLSMQTMNKTITSPSQDQYEELQERYPDTLQCFCTEISIPYGDLIEITPIYHQVCTSDFVRPWWYQNLIVNDGVSLSLEFGVTASSYFQMLAVLCDSANLTTIQAYRRFSLTRFINAQVLPSNLFISQTQALIDSFLNSLRADFIYTLSLINTVLQANQYVSVSQRNTLLEATDLSIILVDDETSLQIYLYSFYYPLISGGGYCYCARDPGCTMVGYLNEYQSLEGVHIGCLMTDAVSQSSLVCWYNDSCMEQVQTEFDSAGVTTFNTATKLNSSLNSSFPPDTLVQTIIENVMADQWQSSTSYTNFYQKCRPALCSYTYQERSSAIFIITKILGLFGGLNIALRLISRFAAKIFFKFIHKRTTQEPPLAFIDQEAVERKYDIRGRGAAYFELLSLLCSTSQTTFKNAVNQFVEETFVNAQAISRSSFFVQTNATIHQFQTSTASEFSRTLQLIRDITHGNTFISSLRLNWRWLVVSESGNSTVPTDTIPPTNNCSCGTRSDCVQPGGICMVGFNYGLFGIPNIPNIPTTQMFAMPGFNVGCSSVETLLRSTFECLYNQTCIDQLQVFAITIYPGFPNATDYITAMNSTFVSRFQPNTTVVDIVNELFIEQWQVNVSYSKFYEQCAPTYCSYTLETSPTFIYILTQTIGIYGGLTVALRYISLYTIQLASYIGNRGRNNRVAPLT